MTDTLTYAELARLEELAAKATPGEWYESVTGEGVPSVNASAKDAYHGFSICIQGMIHNTHNTSYIAAACNAVPSLVAEVRRLRETVDTNAMFYMDVTTVCPDCTMQGKPSDGCQLCDGRGRAFMHDVLRRGNAQLETLRDAGEGLENDGYMANAFGKKGQEFPFPPYSQKWWEAVALNAARPAQENAALRSELEQMKHGMTAAYMVGKADGGDLQAENAALRERVEALEWLREVEAYALDASIFELRQGAIGELENTYDAAREAIS